MKLYLNLLSIFLGIFAISSLAMAEIPTTEIAAPESIENISSSSASGTSQLSDEGKNPEVQNTSDTEPMKAEESTETTAAEESKNNPVFVQCPVTELVIDSAPILQADAEKDAKKIVTDSDINLEISYEELIADFETINSESSKADPSYVATTAEELLTESPSINESKTQDIEPEEVVVESSSTAETQIEETEEFKYSIDCLNPKKYAYYQRLSIADNLYRAGNKLSAARIYRGEKEAWDRELNPIKPLPEANYDPTKLSAGGAVYWRIYQEGKRQELESKILTPLKLLVASEPEFIPGHLSYAESLLAYEKEEESLEVLENATSLYPQDSKLLRAKIAADIRSDKWLDASISARQFALFNPQLPEATEFTQLADEYLDEFKSDIREQLAFSAIGNVITGAVGFALTGNIFGPISAIDTTVMLLQGESSLGERFSKRAQKQLPMVENEAVLNYVREVGNKVAAASGRDEFEYEFHVVMADNINAFALPGGKIFINLGVIMNTESEAELAGLLAHEIAHAVLSHGFQLATRGSLTANVTQYIPYIGGTAGNLIVMNYSRDMEKQADIYGTRILVASDYAADGVRDLMAKLQQLNEQDEDHVEPPAWLSTHPNTKERVRYMEELIVSDSLNRYAYEGVERHYQIKQLAKKLWQEYEKEQAAKGENEYYH
ncbi:MAG: M48 family metallopeptidase [Xenococcus sp. MO_188.B8]|nr:M48 family metallopeptidase [Xenococcus sp. MO_188.B8]